MSRQRAVLLCICLGGLVGAQGCLCGWKLVVKDPVCGDGRAQGEEQCDLMDLKGMTCHDVLPGAVGNLRCHSTCTFDMRGCSFCGDGIVQDWEECDCGMYPGHFPDGCTDINGGLNANCTESCVKIAVCGDGVRDAGESCDCGLDPTNLPLGCSHANGEIGSSCSEHCTDVAECWAEVYFEPCNPSFPGQCCPDRWGVWPVCAYQVRSDYGYVCQRSCVLPTDCFWSHSCEGTCELAICNPTGMIGHSINAFCEVSGGGGQGWCWPLLRRFTTDHGSVGICMEAGDLSHGASCLTLEGTMYDKDAFVISALAVLDRSETACNMGYCAAPAGSSEGRCRQFCDWEAAYAVAMYGADPESEILPCPVGTGCVAWSHIDSSTGIRSGDLAFCHDTGETDPVDGFFTCSLVTDQLLADPERTCADLSQLSLGRCRVPAGQDGQLALGSLVGLCESGEAPVWSVWELCDDTVDGTDLCPPGSVCARPDLFAVEGEPGALTARCLPYCDIAHPVGPQPHCEALGAEPTGDGTPVCQSMSLLFPPGGRLDQMPTRLGLCGL